MNHTRLRFLAMSALLSLTGAVLGDGVQDKTLEEIAGYRSVDSHQREVDRG